MADEPTYTPNLDAEGKWYAKGPGDGFGYHSGYLMPETRFVSEEEAKRVCRLLTRAHSVGYGEAQQDMRRALGMR